MLRAFSLVVFCVLLSACVIAIGLSLLSLEYPPGFPGPWSLPRRHASHAWFVTPLVRWPSPCR